MTDNSETVRRKIERAYTESGVADIRNTAEWARQQEAVVREYAHLVRRDLHEDPHRWWSLYRSWNLHRR